MAEVGWTLEAETWLKEVLDFIALDNPDAAIRVVSEIHERVDTLRVFLYAGYRYRVSERHVRVLL